MGKRDRYRDHIDPDYRRWGRRYPHFPGVAECARLVRDGKAAGSWADIIVHELAENAAECFTELVETFRTDSCETVRLYVVMALDIARLPQSVPFLTEVLREANPVFTPYALRALHGMDSREAWRSSQSEKCSTESRDARADQAKNAKASDWKKNP